MERTWVMGTEQVVKIANILVRSEKSAAGDVDSGFYMGSGMCCAPEALRASVVEPERVQSALVSTAPFACHVSDVDTV